MRARERPDPEDGRAVTAASDKLSELERQRQTMVQVAREYRDFVQHGRATLLRMRKAATELARDEARLQGEINGLQETLSRTRAARDEAAAAFDRVRGEVAAGDPAAPLDAHAALAWESAGKAARRWRETVTEAEAAERDVAVRTEEHEEVRFQLGQFRGRIAAYEVDLADDGDFAGEAGAYRKRMTEAHRRFIAAVDETARMVDQLCKRFGLS
jgi:ubiquinone biosynthesis protein UbiJ